MQIKRSLNDIEVVAGDKLGHKTLAMVQRYLRAQADWTERTHVMFPRLDPRQLIDFGLTR